jgi:hypothetical protein
MRDCCAWSDERGGGQKDEDVEGHEAAVLRGAQRTIEKHRPLLMIEGANRRPKVAKRLRRLGYLFAVAEGDRLRLFGGVSDRPNGFFAHHSRLSEYAGAGMLCAQASRGALRTMPMGRNTSDL